MKVIIAPDSFKGSITASKASMIMKQAIESVLPHAKTIIKPMADGGEGTIEAIISSKLTKKVTCECRNAEGDYQTVNYLVIDDHQVVIEYAMIAGLAPLHGTKTPEDYTSYGLGEVILDAVNRGYKAIFIAIGGSATNDAGIGMLSALGVRFFDEDDNELGYYAKDIHQVHKICFARLDTRFGEIQLNIIADVTNPLCGEKGASYVYGPQKGLKLEQIKAFDASFVRFAALCEQELEQEFALVPGAGAAGGLGFALMLLGGKIKAGAKTIGEMITLEKAIATADLVITGEGKSDYQTLFGKAPAYVAELALKYNVPVILLSGALQDREQLNRLFTSCFSIASGPMTLGESMNQIEALLYQQMKQIMLLISSER